MISFHNILSIAKYERKTLLRSWFFRIFSALSLLVLFGMNFGMVIEGGGGDGWVIRAIPSAIPYFNLLILNVAQAIIAVFLASDFLKRDKKLDTTEVIYMRSMTNGEYIFGKTWGNLQVFLVLNVLVVILALIFNLLAQDTSVNWEAYGIYLVLISIPTLIFIMGLSFLMMSIIRNQAITFVLILGYIGITLFVLQAKYYYIFDYMSFNIPMLKSDIIGFGNIGAILIHRGIYFSLGIGFIFLTIFMLKRLPQSESTTVFSLIFSIVFIVIGIYLGYGHIHQFKKTATIRTEAVDLNNKYVKGNFPNTLKESISLEHKGNVIVVKSTLVLKNNSESTISNLVLSLNNGLKVTSLKIEGKETPFVRDLHLILVNNQVEIQPGAEINVEVEYEGTIDEAFCYLDIDEKTFQEKYGKFVINIDKRYAFVTPGYLLLTPETNWYPRTGVTFSSQDVGWNRPEFINFSLEVKTNPAIKAISQGNIKEISAGQFVFENEHPLTQISLAIGDYEFRKVEKKGIEFGIWLFKGHDFFSEFFKEIKDTIPNIVSERFEDFERSYNLQYSFKRLSMVEVPAQLKTFERIWTSSQELVQPEQILIPEKGFMLQDADFKNMMKRQERYGHGKEQGLSPAEIKLQIFNNFLASFTREQGRPNFQRATGGNVSATETTSPYFIFPMLYKFQNNITSTRWPITNRIFEAYLKSQAEDMMASRMRDMTGMSEDEMANIALQDSSFAEILANTAQKTIIDNVIKLKGNVLFSMIQWKAGETEFGDYLRKILNDHKFANITFEEFDKGILEKFGIELTPIMEDWFKEKILPGYLFSPVTAVKVKTNDMIRTMVSFKATNFSNIEGIVKISFRLGGFGGRGGGFGMGMGPGVDNSINKILYLAPHQTKEVSYLLDTDPRMITINTMTSKNIPQVITQSFREIAEDLKAVPFDGEKILEKPVTVALPNETIVDNEDPGFEVTVQKNNSLLKKWLTNKDVTTAKYSGYNTWHPPTSWTLTTNSAFFGEYIRSGYYIKSGDGSMKAKWHVPVKESAYYEVYYYLYKSRDFRRGGPGGGPGGGGEQKGAYLFTIHHDDGSEDVSLEFSTAVDGWNLLGSFHFSPDTALIELSNKSELSTINADAIKIVKL
jgi:hypothetical protein